MTGSAAQPREEGRLGVLLTRLARWVVQHRIAVLVFTGIVCVLCMLMCFSGCASDRKKTAWERQYETLQEQGYGFGNEANAKAYRDRIRGN